MLNESLQWTVLLAVGLLLLGVLRQVGLMMPAPSRSARSGPELGRRLPRRVLAHVERSLPHGLNGGVTLGFVTENCTGCQRLLGNIRRHPINDQDLVLLARSPSSGFREALADLDVSTIYDEAGDLWDACGITETPLLLRLDGQGRVVAKEVSHRVGDVVSAGN